MRIAALYDIHGNLPALKALLAEIKEIQPDLIVIGGDIVSGPIPGETLDCLLQLGERVRFIRGNGDREVVAAFDGQPLAPTMPEDVRAITHWVARQLTPTQRDFLAALPEQFEVQVDGLGDVIFCHATIRNDEELFTPLTPPVRLETIFSSARHDIIVCGHTHTQFDLKLGNRHIVNAGSVGMPYADQPGAYWLLLDSRGYEFQYTTYDKEAAAQEIRASGYPQAQDFADENILKIPTAAEAISLFERMAEERWSQNE